MPRSQHNGANFHYVVEYKRLSSEKLLSSKAVVVSDWNIGEFVVDDQPVFTAYEIAVKAVNSIGTAPENLLDVRIGYSGEDGLHF